MYSLRIKTFVGNETRISWSKEPSPRESKKRVSRASLGTSVLSEVLETQLRGEDRTPPPLVNRLDSEEVPRAGNSGFGSIPRKTIFGLPARRQVKRIAAVLDTLGSSPGDLIFFTGTLPGSTDSSLLALSQWSGFVVHRFKAWMHDISNRYNCLYVWEWQKRGALHLHLVVFESNKNYRKKIFEGMKAQWIRILEQVSNRSGVDLFARRYGKGSWRGKFDKIRARAEWVRKSVAAYMGKYLSKAVRPGGERTRLFYPSRWWGCTKNLKEIERNERRTFEYFCLLPRDAESSYNSVVPLIELFSDWSTSYRHKVVAGNTTVSIGCSPSRLKEILGAFIPMKEVFTHVELKDIVPEAIALWHLIIRDCPDWMAGLENDSPAARKLTDHLTTSGKTPGLVDDIYDLYHLLFTAYWFLRDEACRNRRYCMHYMPYRYTVSIRSTYKRLESALEEWEKQHMFHALEDYAYPGREVG
jgi:hypothetical protein